MRVALRYINSPVPAKLFLAICWLILNVTSVNSQVNIILVTPDIYDLKGYDRTAILDDKNRLFDEIWNLGYFSNSLSFRSYDRMLDSPQRLNNFCDTHKAGFFLTWKITKDSIAFNINFQMYKHDLNQIDNHAIKNIKTNFTYESVQKIRDFIREQMEYFIRNDYEFKEFVPIDEFDIITNDTPDKYGKDFPKWMMEKLNDNNSSSRFHYFEFITENLTEYLKIDGSLSRIKQKDSLIVKFCYRDRSKWIMIVVDENYTNDEDKIIDYVMQLLNEQE